MATALAKQVGKQVGKKSPRTSYHHGNLQAELLAGAMTLVRTGGPENFSLRSLAGAIGVSPSAVYHYYSDKDSLIETLCTQLFTEMAEMQREALEAIPGKSAKAAKERFRAIGRVYFQWAAREPHLFHMMFSGHSDLTKADSAKAADTDAYQTLTGSLDELLEVGVLNPKIRPYGEMIAWAAVHGAASLILEGVMPRDNFEDLLDGLELALFLPGKRS